MADIEDLFGAFEETPSGVPPPALTDLNQKRKTDEEVIESEKLFDTLSKKLKGDDTIKYVMKISES